MLFQLSIRNFALIDELDLNFCKNLNVLTGETGAGKSIIIDAVSLLLGSRSQSQFIRQGTEKSLVEGTFEVPLNHPVEITLQELGFNLEEDRLLILTREIQKNGKNLCRVNNRIITLTNFKKIGSQLINIYGQHDFQSLSQEEKHLNLLDSLGNENYKELLEKVAKVYQQWQNNVCKLNNFTNELKDKEQKLDFLKFQVNEIAELNLTEDEDVKIDEELDILNNMEKIVSVTNRAYNLLYGNDSMYDKLSKVIDDIENIKELDKQFNTVFNTLTNIQYDIEEQARLLRDYCSNINFDSQRVDFLQERKYEISKLKRKYGKNIDEILNFKKEAEKQINQLEQGEIFIDELVKITEKAQKEYLSVSEELSKKRKEIANILEENITKQLVDLAMPHTKFKIDFSKINGNEKGIDKVQFLISPNPGEPLKPLSKIASGGEMSRIMLAFKVILAKTDYINTLIFDEIDTGIGGFVVKKVADKLSILSMERQVICVTHSPQIASCAHKHFKINKKIIGNETLTFVYDLNEKDKVMELARMLGNDDNVTVQLAKEMRKKAKINVYNV